ncbi:MAG: hypothetical protein SXV54_12080, partial [Chloroflexota bacterium]|nr:hypothetical protein [Chloroflexota bacterium]
PFQASGFQYAKSACLKLNFCQHPDLPGHPPHVSVSWALPQAFASWAILLHHGMRPGRLLQHYLREHVTGFPVPCIHFA